MSDPCPCGSGSGYDACCGRFHAGAEAPTAEALMRSRYCAFVRKDAAYISRTCHSLLRTKLDIRTLGRSFSLGWLGLEIVATSAGGPDDREGMVHFRARFRTPDGQEHTHDEHSRFVRQGGAWVYRDDRG